MISEGFLVFSGGNDRAILAFLRSLRCCGQRAAVVARTSDDLVLRSHYRAWVVHTREDHTLDMDVFREGLEAAKRSTGRQRFTVFPATEYFNQFLLEHRGEIERLGCDVPLVEASLYDMLSNKRSATDFFQAAGVNVPEEFQAGDELRFPVVAKPSKNIGVDGGSLYPEFVASRDSLGHFLQRPNASQYFLQEFVTGKSVYLMFYIPKGSAPPVLWSQRNLLQQPGGKSMLLAEASDFHLSEHASRIVGALRSCGFWGLGMVEIIVSAERAVFIEMNPRPWGPLQLCVDACSSILESFIAESIPEGAVPEGAVPEGAGRRVGAKEAAGVRKAGYGWTIGLIQTLLRGRQPVWHRSRGSLLWAFISCLRDDVYLRRDSWRCFPFELVRSIRELRIGR